MVMMMMMVMMNRNRQPHPPGPVCELTPAPAAAGVGGVKGIFFVNRLSLSLYNFRNFPGHSTGKQRTDDTRRARSARTRKGALTSVVSKAPPFSKKKWENLARRKMPNLQHRIPHQRAERIFFFWARPMHQGGRNGATKPPLRARKGALTSVVSKVRLFKQKIGWKCGENAQSTKPNSASTCRAIFFSGLGQCTKTGARAQRANFSVPEGLAAKSSSALSKWAGRRRACFSSFWGLFSSGRRPPRGAPIPPLVWAFDCRCFGAILRPPPHLSTLITTKITFPCNLLEITGADFLYMEIARLYSA